MEIGRLVDRREVGVVVYRLERAEILVYPFKDVTQMTFMAETAIPPVNAPQGTDREYRPQVLSASVLVDRFQPEMLREGEFRIPRATDPETGHITYLIPHEQDLTFNTLVRVSRKGDSYQVRWTAGQDPDSESVEMEIEGSFRLRRGAPIPFRLRDMSSAPTAPLLLGLLLGGLAGWLAASALGWSVWVGAFLGAVIGFVVGVRFGERESIRRGLARMKSLEAAGSAQSATDVVGNP